MEEFGSLPFVSLDLMAGSGSGSFSHISSYLTVGQPDTATVGLVAGAFKGSDGGLQVAVPISNGGDNGNYVDVDAALDERYLGQRRGLRHQGVQPKRPSRATSWRPTSTACPAELGIALTNGDAGEIWVLLAGPDWNQFLPLEQVSAASSGTSIGMLAVAPFDAQAATAGYRGPTNDPSTLVQNTGGSWTRTYPDGTVIEFQLLRPGDLPRADSNGNTTSYAYVTSGMLPARCTRSPTPSAWSPRWPTTRRAI